MIGIFSFSAFSAITTTFEYDVPADYTLETDYNQEISGGELILGEQYEVQINDEIESLQFFPYFTKLSSGNVFVAWASRDTNHSGNDDTGYHVAAKIVDYLGRTIIQEFQVNQSISANEFPSSVLELDDGNIMIIYDGEEIFGIVYDTNGEVVVDEFPVNELTDGAETYSNAVKMRNGNVFVSWRSNDPGTADNDGPHIAAKIIGPDGSTIVNEFLVNETYDENQFQVIAHLLEGSIPSEDKVIVVWQHGAATTYDHFAKIYNTDGTVSKPEFTLTTGSGVQDPPDIVKVEDDVFFMVYESDDTAVGTDASSSAIEARVIDGEGIELLSAFELNEETDGFQFEPMASVLTNGDIYVTWSSQDTDHSGDDNDGYHIAGKVVNIADNGSGLEVNVVTPEFQVNKDIVGDQRGAVNTVNNGTIMNFFYSTATTPRYGNDNDSRHIALLSTREDLTYYNDVYGPASSLSSGVVMSEAFREVDVAYGSGNEGSVNMQISNDDGVTWYYFDGTSWVSTTEGVEESNTVSEVNTNLVSFFTEVGTGTMNAKLFLVSDGLQEVIVDSLSFLENETPVIGTGDAVVNLDIPQDRTRVATIVNTDPETDEVTLSISGGADAGLFSIQNTNELHISLDGDLGETYEVVIRATDQFGGFTEQTINATVVRVAPSNGSSSGGGGAANPFGEEIQTNVGMPTPEQPEVNPIEQIVENQLEEEINQSYLNRETRETEKGEFCVRDFINEYTKLSTVNRLEGVKLLLDLLCVDVTESNFLKEFDDTQDLSTLDQMYINKAYELRLIQGYPDDTFRPNQKLNYAEMSALLYRSLQKDTLESSPWFVEYIKVVPIVEEERLSELINADDFLRISKEFFGF